MAQREPLLIGVKDVARLCGVSPNTVWNRCNPGHPSYISSHPKPIKIGGRTFWRTRKIERFVAELFADRKSRM